MRIVFDTNIHFSAFTSHDACAGLYEECIERAEIVVSPFMLAELAEKLRTKAHFTAAEIREVPRAVRADAEVVKAVPRQTPSVAMPTTTSSPPLPWLRRPTPS